MIWPDPTHKPTTHPPTHPPNYTLIQGWGSLHRFQIFKQNWNISISSCAIEFWMILGVPLGGGWMGEWGWGLVRGCIPPMCTCMCMHARTCTCTHIWHHREFLGIPPNGGGHLHEIIMFTTHACACMCMRACVCMCMCVGAPPNHPHPHPPTPLSPRATGSRKHQNSITLELIKIIRFCLKIFYLWTFLNSYRL